MMNNPNHFRHYPRQPNVQIVVTDSKGALTQIYNIVAEMDVFVVHGVTMLEVREYATPTSPDPASVTMITNPARWMLIAQPDPERLQLRPEKMQ